MNELMKNEILSQLSIDDFNDMKGKEQEPNAMSSENNFMGLKNPSGRLGPQWAIMVVKDCGLGLSSGIENVSIHSQMS